MTLIGPGPTNVPDFPTPWLSENERVYDAADQLIATTHADNPALAAALAEALVRMVNEQHGHTSAPRVFHGPEEPDVPHWTKLKDREGDTVVRTPYGWYWVTAGGVINHDQKVHPWELGFFARYAPFTEVVEED